MRDARVDRILRILISVPNQPRKLTQVSEGKERSLVMDLSRGCKRGLSRLKAGVSFLTIQ